MVRSHALLSAVFSDLRALVASRFLIRNLVATELKLRYHRSVLGVFWTLLNPLLLLSVQALAFSQILHIDFRTYALYLLSGLVPWQFFSTAIETASRSMLKNEKLIRVMPTPKLVFPLSDVIVALVHSGFALAAFLILAVAFGASLQRQLLVLPVGILLLALFTFGLTLIAMTLMTFFRDFAHIIGVLLTAYYFASPILYPPDLVSRYRAMLRFNPMTYYLEFFHDALVPARVLNAAAQGAIWPPPTTWIVATLCSLLSVTAGYIVYKKMEHEFIFHL